MALPFPNVPIAPGVPVLPRDPFAAAVSIALLTADAVASFFFNVGPQWGVFLDGFPVVAAQSVVSMEYRQDWIISDYPLEQGAFESYDKVNTPFLARVRFASGGDIATRQALLLSIEAIAGDTNLYDVVTPERVYTSVNVGHYDYRRAAQNVGLLEVDVWLVQVNVTAVTLFSNTQSASGANPVDGGGVQTTPATPAQQSAVIANTPTGLP